MTLMRFRKKMKKVRYIHLALIEMSGLVFMLSLGYNSIMDFVLHQKGHVYESYK